jgi:4-hydroxymandelate oxidase
MIRKSPIDRIASRRKFLRYLALSPAPANSFLMEGALCKANAPNWGVDQRKSAASTPITTAAQALNVMEFEELARKALPPAHFAYLATDVDDDATVRLNCQANQEIEIRSRRLIDVAKLDTSVELFGTKWETPIFLCPVSSMKVFDPEG